MNIHFVRRGDDGLIHVAVIVAIRINGTSIVGGVQPYSNIAVAPPVFWCERIAGSRR